MRFLSFRNNAHSCFRFLLILGISIPVSYTHLDVYKRQTLWKSEIRETMWSLPVGDLFYVGHSSKRQLRDLGIFTIGELADMDPVILRSFMKSQGVLIWQYANGIDESEAVSYTHLKRFSFMVFGVTFVSPSLHFIQISK